MNIPLKTTNCVIRSFKASDLAALLKHANNPKVSMHLRDSFPSPYTREDGREWINLASNQIPETNFCIAIDKELIGGIGLRLFGDVHCKTAEIGYWLGESFWNQGITSAATHVFTQWAFDNFDLDRVFAHVFANNPGSRRVLEKTGYSYEGCSKKSIFKNGRTLDSYLYAITK